MAGTGYATGMLAGLPAIVFARSDASLPPSFHADPSFIGHAVVAAILVGVIVMHLLAACYHQFVRQACAAQANVLRAVHP